MATQREVGSGPELQPDGPFGFESHVRQRELEEVARRPYINLILKTVSSHEPGETTPAQMALEDAISAQHAPSDLDARLLAYWEVASPENEQALTNELLKQGVAAFFKPVAQLMGWPDPGQQLLGLALSGGGIRSATFNLGVLQGLAGLNWLRCFDFLSTVSGGGYIGSWLVAWIKRRGFAKVSQQLRPDWKEHDEVEPPEIEFLRTYSNYLTPQLGLLSGDTWSMVAIWFRNFLLNLIILVLIISALLLVPRVVVSLSQSSNSFVYAGLTMIFMLFAIFFTGLNMKLFSPRPQEYPSYSQQGVIQWTIAIPTVLASWLGSCWLWNEGRNWVENPLPPASAPESWLSNELRKLVSILPPWLAWTLLVALLTFLVWLVVWFLAERLWPKRMQAGKARQAAGTVEPLVWPPMVFFSLIEGAVGGVLLFGLASLYNYLWKAGYPGNHVHFVALGTGLVASVLGIMVTVHMGLMGKRFPDERREWWSRTGALVTICSLGWTAFFALALYGPLLVQWSSGWVKGTLTLGWLAHTIYGALGARSEKTAQSGPDSQTGFLLKTAPFIFVIGLLILLSFGIYSVLRHGHPNEDQGTVSVTVDLNLSQDATGIPPTVSTSVKPAATKGHVSYHHLAEAYWPSVWCDSKPCLAPATKEEQWDPISPWQIVLLIVVCAGVAALLSWRVDINEFSMQLFYRNRLVRCYLGASHQAGGQPAVSQGGGAAEVDRNPNPFTGFDPADDLWLTSLAPSAELKAGELRYGGPYPILNATLNVTHGKRLAWQERKAQSFVFTPLYCGYEVGPDRQPLMAKKKPLEMAGYRPTSDYLYSEPTCQGGPYLGTAMGISGAAISPNMGYHTSPALAFLMTVFNVRLGRWAGNPRHQGGRWTGNPIYKLGWRSSGRVAPPWKRRGPGLGILYLLLELLGSTDDQRAYVYLSDGGHFEDLGIYELVRRRCKLILACDASEDRDYKFEDLGKAIRKCRDDFGVDIRINIDNLRPQGKSGENAQDDAKKSRQHCAVGVISYDKARDNAKPGILIYVKASLTGNEPTDVLQYRDSHPDFPHDSTADQWFTESQFESYRKLGQHIIEQYGGTDHGSGQKMKVLDLLEVGQWNDRTTSGSLEEYLSQNLGDLYSTKKPPSQATGV